MTDSPTQNQKPETENAADDSLTGLPLLSTWPRLYAVVLLTFVACVVALTLLTRAYS